MNSKLVIKIVLCVVMAVLTFAFVWGVYIAALLISLSARGDASYAIGLITAMAVQLIAYKVAPRWFRRLQRWLACSVGPLAIMGIFTLAFKGGGNFEMLGGSFNLSLLIAMLCFGAVTGFWELISHFLLHRVKNDDDEEADEEASETKPESEQG